jgi:hypothetical protein
MRCGGADFVSYFFETRLHAKVSRRYARRAFALG